MRLLFLVICLCQILCFTSKNGVAAESIPSWYSEKQQRVAALTPRSRAAYDAEVSERLAQQQACYEETRLQANADEIIKRFKDAQPGTPGYRLRITVLAVATIKPDTADAATSPIALPPSPQKVRRASRGFSAVDLSNLTSSFDHPPVAFADQRGPAVHSGSAANGLDLLGDPTGHEPPQHEADKNPTRAAAVVSLLKRTTSRFSLVSPVAS